MTIAIIDDWFPSLTTGFRVAEFVDHLKSFPDLTVFSSSPAFDRDYAQFATCYPDVAQRVRPMNMEALSRANAAWLVFLNNAFTWVQALEQYRIPFVFTLYPGGGFNLNDPQSEMKLARVLASPLLRGVVATQPITADELRRMHCAVPIYNIPGVVVDPARVARSAPRSPDAEPRPVGVCFAGYRYETGAASKGYPEFIAAAEALAYLLPDIRFTIIGNISPQDWPIAPALRGRVTFRGALSADAMHACLLEQDIMVAPSRRFARTGREFDGFPTGTAVEASLCGALIVASDELRQNRAYLAGEEIIVVEPVVEELVDVLERLIGDRPRLAAIAEAGRKRSCLLYSADSQLATRRSILRELSAC
jgi:lipopolysaccharide transport system ATP-binding protein